MKFSSILKQIMSYHISYIYQFIFSKQTNYKHVAKTCLRHIKNKHRSTRRKLSKYQWQPPCLTLNMLKSATLFPSKFFFTKRTSSCFFPAEIGSKSASLWATCCSQCAQKKQWKHLSSVSAVDSKSNTLVSPSLPPPPLLCTTDLWRQVNVWQQCSFPES